MTRSLISILLFSFVLQNVSAAELYNQGINPRGMAMGGTYMSFVRGADGLFYNPAVLTRVEGFDFLIADVDAAYSTDTKGIYDIYKNSGNTLTAADINSLYGKNAYVSIGGRSGFAMPYVGFGVYTDNYTLLNFNNPPFPTFNANLISDYGYVLGGGIPIGPQTSLGIAYRHVTRLGGSKDILVTDLVGSDVKTLLQSKFQDKGVANALDLSFVTTLPIPLMPTVSVMWKDVGRTTFTQTEGTTAPPSQGDNLTLGISTQSELIGLGWTNAFEYSNITTPDESISKKLHFGTELSFGLFDVRAGLNQGYFTYGGGINIWLLRADMAYYSSELGTTAGQIRSDRVIYSLTLEIDLDQTFKLKDTDGKSRRLKQRR
ncbi:MAG: hypothetical protein H7256_03855 [Bdellovibrio sp.]|nr:hypothetical protein [Bdellovibrio sp.]